MTDITDKSRKPTVDELALYIANPLYDALRSYMGEAHKALVSVEYSGDVVLPGWNVRFRKGGKTLLRLYPKRGYFSVLVVIGRKEKPQAEALLPQMSAAIQQIYHSTKEGMGQRWLLIDLHEADALYNDVLTLAALRRG